MNTDTTNIQKVPARRLIAVKAIAAAGGPMVVAEHFSISVQAIYQWRSKGVIPHTRCIALERLGGARVTRYQMRPDVFGRGARK